jgi:putative ABC transport system permease protein
VSTLLRDIRYSFRTLLRAPLFTVVVVATLALGIGANTAIFSVVNAVLLEKLPYPDADRLVTVWHDVTKTGGALGNREWLNYPTYQDLRDEPGLFSAVGVWTGWGPTLTGVEDPVVLQGAGVSHEMFSDVLGVRPALGRGFLPSDDVEGSEGVVLLSWGLWQSRFGGASDVVGRSINLSETPYTVVGVMPEGFSPPFAPGAQLWRALGASGAQDCGRGCFGMRAVARLAPGVSMAQARTHLAALATRLEEAYPETRTNVGLSMFGLRDDLTREASRPLWVLLGAVGFVLLIACTNVANLLLARGAAREGELAVRVALGAGRGPIVAQMLTESLVLSILGGGAGLALASWATDALLKLAPAGAVPRLDTVGMSGPVLAFTAGVTVLTGLLFGLVPAWRASRQDVRTGLHATGRGASGGLRLRSALAVTQVALALVLLVGAGLLIRSFQRLNGADLGFSTQGVMAMNVTTRYADGAERRAFYQALLSRLSGLPGVEAAGAVSALPMAGYDGDATFRIEGEPPPERGVNQAAWVRPVTDGYFETVHLALMAGRGFRPGDDADGDRVVVINQTMARQYFPEGDALGRRIAFGSSDEPTWRTVVGIAHDVRQFGVREPARPAVYLPYRQVSFAAMFVVVRTDGDPTSLVPDMREAVSGLDPSLAASNVQPLQTYVDASLAPDRFVTSLLTLFALVALLLSAVGIYGVVSYGVTRRMREMGIRVALGAEGADVLRLVVRGALVMAGTGVALGMVGSLALGKMVAGLLYDVPPTDPVTFLATAAILGGVAVLAAWMPARRAMRADPVSVLRQE